MNSDARISYWRKGKLLQNFGDLLSEILFQALTRRDIFDWQAGRSRGIFDVVHLIGSVISPSHITWALEHSRALPGQKVAFWCCGARETKPIEEDLLQSCAILGVRGPLSRDVLGLPSTTTLGDPGLLLPLLYSAQVDPLTAGKSICVPHYLEPRSDADLLKLSGADIIIRPSIPPDIRRLHAMINMIAGAKFVMAGALHAAITAFAYGTPFSYFDSGFIDVQFKWADFAQSIGIQCQFVKSTKDGLEFYEDEIRQHSKGLCLEDILICAPFQPPRKLLMRARRYDSQNFIKRE